MCACVRARAYVRNGCIYACVRARAYVRVRVRVRMHACIQICVPFTTSFIYPDSAG
jgi:hypothetical protein